MRQGDKFEEFIFQEYKEISAEHYTLYDFEDTMMIRKAQYITRFFVLKNAKEYREKRKEKFERQMSLALSNIFKEMKSPESTRNKSFILENIKLIEDIQRISPDLYFDKETYISQLKGEKNGQSTIKSGDTQSSTTPEEISE